MPKRHRSEVREPLQVYLSPDERGLLDRLAADQGISRAEVLRRGIRAYAHEQAGSTSPVFDLMSVLSGDDWPADVAGHHDEHLSDAYRDR
jgi:hypothetical protein